MPRGFGGENEAGRASDPSGMSLVGVWVKAKVV